MRVTPGEPAGAAARPGRCATSLVLLVQAILLIARRDPVRPARPGRRRAARSLLVVACSAVAFSSLSYAAALRLKSEDALAPLLNSVACRCCCCRASCCRCRWRPRWLRRCRDVNPFNHVVDGVRAVFRGDLGTSTAGWGLFWAVVLVRPACWWGPGRSGASPPEGAGRAGEPRRRTGRGRVSAVEHGPGERRSRRRAGPCGDGPDLHGREAQHGGGVEAVDGGVRGWRRRRPVAQPALHDLARAEATWYQPVPVRRSCRTP